MNPPKYKKKKEKRVGETVVCTEKDM